MNKMKINIKSRETSVDLDSGYFVKIAINKMQNQNNQSMDAKFLVASVVYPNK